MKFKLDLWKGRSAHQGLTVHLIIISFLSAVFAFFFLVSPDKIEKRSGILVLMPRCLFKTLTGIPCPTCGMTRAFSSISHWEFRRAFDYNYFSIPLYFLLAAIWLFFVSSLVFHLRRL